MENHENDNKGKILDFYAIRMAFFRKFSKFIYIR